MSILLCMQSVASYICIVYKVCIGCMCVWVCVLVETGSEFVSSQNKWKHEWTSATARPEVYPEVVTKVGDPSRGPPIHYTPIQIVLCVLYDIMIYVYYMAILLLGMRATTEYSIIVVQLCNKIYYTTTMRCLYLWVIFFFDQFLKITNTLRLTVLYQHASYYDGHMCNFIRKFLLCLVMIEGGLFGI